ncbi:HD domain-containing protein [bacterium]|nr:HD domain-containing protein [bacterium]
MKFKLEHPVFNIVAEEGAALGCEVYVVGGFVRDQLLRRPSKDVDFLIIGSGINLAERVKKRFNKANLAVYKNFGTALLKTDDWEFEFVGARKESYRKDSRKPIVEDGSFEDDIARRDFTINSMAIALNEDGTNQLIDLYNGIEDLDQCIIRTPLDPEVTFSDDPLRMMRAARFASQLNFEISSEAFDAMSKNAKRLNIISQERITDELNKIMLSHKPSIGFKILFSSGLLHEFFPELTAMQGVEYRENQGHKDNFYHTLKVLDKVAAKSDNIWLRWVAVFHDIAKPPTKRFSKEEGWTFHGHEDKGSRMVKGIFKKLKLPLGEPMRYVSKLVKLHHRPIALTNENITDSAIRRLIFDAGDDLEDLILFCRCDITTKNKEKEKRFLANLDKVEEAIVEVEERDRIRNWQPPIDGSEIMEIFNIGAGRHIGEIKNALKDAILDGQIANNYEDAYRFVIEQGKRLGLKKEEE